MMIPSQKEGMAMRAGMVRREFAKTDAQAVDRAIDEILKVWGAE